MPLYTTAIYVGLNALITMSLAILVVRQRLKTKTNLGDGDNQSMTLAVRAHANNTENVPIALIIIGVIEGVGAHIGFVHGLGILLTVSRILHAQGLSSSAGRSPGRFLGTVGTWLVYIVGGITCVYYGVMK